MERGRKEFFVAAGLTKILTVVWINFFFKKMKEFVVGEAVGREIGNRCSQFFWVGCSKRWACCCRKSNNSKSVFLAKAAWVDSTLENPDQKLVFAFPKYEN